MPTDKERCLDENIAVDEAPRFNPPLPESSEYLIRAFITACVMAVAGFLVGLIMKLLNIGFDFSFDRLK